jgi:glycosyltransferase involved in cell wall biosynthesis
MGNQAHRCLAAQLTDHRQHPLSDLAKPLMNLLIPHGFEANYIIGFARGIAANGVKFTVISSDELAPRLDAAGIPHCNLRGCQDENRPAWKKAANLARYYVLLLWTIFKNRGSTHHFNGLLTSRIIFIDALLIPLWLRLWAGRYIHTAHNALPHSREHSRLFRLAYRWIYRFPHTILTHTVKVSRQLQDEFSVPPSRITTISIGLNEEVAKSTLTSTEARQQLNLPLTAPLVLFFGKIEHYKGVDLLVQAWDLVQTPNANLVIAGQCPDGAYGRQLRDLIGASTRNSTIHWREGFVPNDTVAVLLAAADVVALPYRNIYQSGVVFLCMNHGIPVVATDVGSMSEFVSPESGIIAKSNDPAGIAAAIDLFFSNRARFDRAGISIYARKYHWNLQCAQIRHLYL